MQHQGGRLHDEGGGSVRAEVEAELPADPGAGGGDGAGKTAEDGAVQVAAEDAVR